MKIPYYVVKGANGYWQPTGAMRASGARPVACGPDGPAAWARARAALDAWRAEQKAEASPRRAPSRPGTLAKAFEEYRATDEWRLKKPRTREEWERCWKRIGPTFGPCRPSEVTLAQVSGFRAAVERNISLREAHRCIKIWRALWTIAAALKYCQRAADPSLGMRNIEPRRRQAIWTDKEARLLVKTAWRCGYRGLAAVIAVAWDTSMSPVDVRLLSPVQRQGNDFRIRRAKTGREPIGTLSHSAARILDAYIGRLGVDIAPTAPIFRNRSGRAYSKDTLGDDFRDIRAVAFGDSERRTLADFRRSGVVEALRGGAAPAQIGSKLGNAFATSAFLQQTYAPTDIATARQVDAARRTGRKAI